MYFTGSGGPESGVDLSLRFAEDIALRKSGVMEIFATYYKEPLPRPPGLPFTWPPMHTLSPLKAYGLIWRVTHMVGDQVQTQYIPQVCTLFTA